MSLVLCQRVIQANKKKQNKNEYSDSWESKLYRRQQLNQGLIIIGLVWRQLRLSQCENIKVISLYSCWVGDWCKINSAKTQW